MESVLEVMGVSKIYDGHLKVLDDVNITLNQADRCAIIGPSGSGKTTLLSLCAGLDSPSSGTIKLLGRSIADLGEEGRARLRNQYIGFVFQSFHLMASLTALENVMLPLELQGGHDAQDRAVELLTKVGLTERIHHYPSQLSGGERQRVAIARAFINQPKILFADEPTGNLDRATSERITELLFELNREQKTTLLLITHDPALAKRTGNVLYLKDGKVQHGA